ncbi:hypothetical protein EAE96_000158 [Botrytis aclada]|nr:hypothetical protein EAE96_000158 [Botrytis aclada]
MHDQSLICFFITLSTFILPTSASPLYYTLSSRDNNQIQSTRTTTCLSDYFGGCCAVDGYGSYGSCTNATLLGSNVPWTGMPTTQTANEWGCATPVNGTVDTSYPNGVILPTLQESTVCTASNAGLSKSKRMEDDGGGMKRDLGDVWSFW